jgi:UDP-N-acetylglucosamine--N-acetylmuramyl-(pentapeptide) pyrophosphoryl-undecaprenol N-acetylglucosamine transferase
MGRGIASPARFFLVRCGAVTVGKETSMGKRPLRVIIAGGGTGGHLFPAIAVAKEIVSRSRDNGVLFVGTLSGLEASVVPREGFDLQTISVGGLKGKRFADTVRNLARLPLAGMQSFRILRRFRPQTVLGVGGYASGPVAAVAFLLRIPILIQEQNVFPGITNRILSRVASEIALPFEETRKHFRGRGVLTGNPVRREFFSIGPRERSDKFRLLVFGGSQGARILNGTMVEALGSLEPFRDRLRIVHQTGAADLDWVKRAYEQRNYDAAVLPFIDAMAAALEASDVVLCRAGASTVSELIAARRAAILVPFAAAANRHQELNARAMSDRGAARLILEPELTPERLAGELGTLIASPENIDTMEAALSKLPRENAAARIVDVLTTLAAKKSK